MGRIFGVSRKTVLSALKKCKKELDTWTSYEYQQKLLKKGFKKCFGQNSCDEIKLLSEFNIRNDTGKHYTLCKVCNKKQSKILKIKYKDRRNALERKRKKFDINYKIKHILRSRLCAAIKNDYKSGSAVNDLGCSIEELKQHLENQFYLHPKTKEEMNWDNYSLHGWHIDHIIPLANFDLTSRCKFLEACCYNNLQPLWAEDNLSKGVK
ncbi:hypothetical protein LCGC14_2634540 [marine sediment metagenome]|uniref:Uncharacterized protein n=1 Tax=marine sediment metagenome TaxID=412755 RepID=A0A0F8ZZG3_9ZZZZ